MTFRGSRMHVLDWVDGAGGSFPALINEHLRPTGGLVFESSERMPKGWNDRDEARFGKECGSLLKEPLNKKLRDWWLSKPNGANIPNWDLACTARFPAGRGLVLVEAKAHDREFADGIAGCGGTNENNKRQIAGAISEARNALSSIAPTVSISSDRWYQVSNRVAFAWKLAAEGIPTALIYLGFIGDHGMSDRGNPFCDHDQWLATVQSQDVVPPELWEREINVNGTPLWLLIRSRPCLRMSPELSPPSSDQAAA